MSRSQEYGTGSQMSQDQHFCEGSVAAADKRKSEAKKKKKIQMMVSFTEMTFRCETLLQDVLKM